MRSLIVVFSAILMVVSGVGCGSKDTCVCKSYEICINNKCELKEGYFAFGDLVIGGVNLFRGVVRGDICPDTFLIDALPLHSQSPSLRYYNLWIKRGNTVPFSFGIPLDAYQIEDNHVFLSGLPGYTHFCGHEGEKLYADFKCRVYPDSIEAEIYFFREVPVVPDPIVYIDTAFATLYKK